MVSSLAQRIAVEDCGVNSLNTKHPLSAVYLFKETMHVTINYYYSLGVFDDVCIHCGDPDDIIKGEEAADILPTCGGCFNYQSKLKVFKRKRNQMQPASKKQQNPHNTRVFFKNGVCVFVSGTKVTNYYLKMKNTKDFKCKPLAEFGRNIGIFGLKTPLHAMY